MKYENLYNEFICLFPDDKQEINKIAKEAFVDSNDGMHVKFGMVVVPYIMVLLENNEQQKLITAFDFFEKMADSNESMISEVLEFTVLEDIISRGKDILDMCKLYMKQKTKESCLSVEKYLM